MIFQQPIIRCALYPDDVRDGNQFVNVATSRQPAMYAGEQVQFEFCLFRRRATPEEDAELYDISNFSGNLKIRIRQGGVTGTVLLDESLATLNEKDPSVTVDTWNDGSKCHFKVFFPESATGITAGDSHYIVVYGPDGDIFGRSIISVFDPGTGAASTPNPGDPVYYTKTEVRGLLEDYARKIGKPGETLALVTQDGKFRIIATPVNDSDGPHLVWNIEEVVNVQP